MQTYGELNAHFVQKTHENAHRSGSWSHISCNMSLSTQKALYVLEFFPHHDILVVDHLLLIKSGSLRAFLHPKHRNFVKGW